MRRLSTFCKLVVNASPTATIVPALLAALVLGVDPEVAVEPRRLLALVGVLGLAYGPPVLVALPAAFTCVRFFAAHDLTIGWFHLKTAVWFLATGTAGTLALDLWNYHRLGESLGPRGRHRFVAAIVAPAIAWLAAIVLASIAQWKEGRARATRLRMAIGLLLAGPLLALAPLALAGPPADEIPSTVPEMSAPGGPVVLLAIDGASFSEILPLASEGKLPNFARLMKEGARGPLRSVKPGRSAAAWASLVTGKLPPRHGVLDPNRYRMGDAGPETSVLPEGLGMRRWASRFGLSIRPVTERDLRARPLWTIFDMLRLEATFLDWPLGAPPPDRSGAPAAPEEARRVADWRSRVAGGAALTVEEQRRLDRAVGVDLAVHTALQRILWSPGRPRVLAARLAGLGIIESTFPHVPHPESVGVVPEESDVRRYSRITDRYYEMLDQIVGQVRAAVPKEGYLLLVSPCGSEPVAAFDRLIRKISGLPSVAAGHDAGPAGILLVAGEGVAEGRQLDDLRIADVVPLTLYALGLPVGHDMDGRLPRRLFKRAFLESHPITFIPTYG